MVCAVPMRGNGLHRCIGRRFIPLARPMRSSSPARSCSVFCLRNTAPYSEDFEGGVASCRAEDDIDWTLLSGEARRAGTRASGDHTSGGGNYRTWRPIRISIEAGGALWTMHRPMAEQVPSCRSGTTCGGGHGNLVPGRVLGRFLTTDVDASGLSGEQLAAGRRPSRPTQEGLCASGSGNDRSELHQRHGDR